jgi:glycosyltransferase involved in cell wall biosynthesis
MDLFEVRPRQDAGPASGAKLCRDGNAVPHILCVGGEDHHLRIPFLQALADRGLRVSAASSGDPESFVGSGIAWTHFDLNRFISPRSDRRSVAQLRAILGARCPDLVQSFDTKPNVLVPSAAARFPGVRVIRTINGMGWVYSATTPVALALRPVQRALHYAASRRAAATVFQNADDQAFFRRHRLVGTGLDRLIPGSGIDAEAFDEKLAAAPPALALRNAFGLGSGPVVITVTRLTRQKGIATLLAAAALVHVARPEVRFLLVGARETEGALAISQAEIDRHREYVIATGARPDVPALLGIADVFAFPTEYREGVPRVLLEAGLASLPIVTTDMPGCNDVVHDGWSGLVVPPRDPRKLAAGVLHLLADRDAARTMGAHAREHVRREFGLGYTVDRYRALYDEVLAMPVGTRAVRMPPFFMPPWRRA